MEGALDVVCHVHGESLLDEIETELRERAPLLYCRVGDFFKTTIIREYPRYEDSWLYLFVVKEKYGDRVVVESVDASLRSPRHMATEFTMRPLFDRPWSSDTPLRIDVAPHEAFFFIPATSDDEDRLDTFRVTHEEADVLCDMWDAFLKRSAPNTSLFAWPSPLPIEYSLCRIGWIESLLQNNYRFLFEDIETAVFKLSGLLTLDWGERYHTDFFIYFPTCKVIGEDEYHEYYDGMNILDIESVRFVCMRSPYVGNEAEDFDFDLSLELKRLVEYEDGELTIPVAKLHHVKLVSEEWWRARELKKCSSGGCCHFLAVGDVGMLPFRHGPLEIFDGEEEGKDICMHCVERLQNDLSYCDKCDRFTCMVGCGCEDSDE